MHFLTNVKRGQGGKGGELNESERENYRYIDIIDIFGLIRIKIRKEGKGGQGIE